MVIESNHQSKREAAVTHRTRLDRLEAIAKVNENSLPFLIAFDHEGAQRIAEAYKRAGRRLDKAIIILDIGEEERSASQ